jgi:hypothetical protein
MSASFSFARDPYNRPISILFSGGADIPETGASINELARRDIRSCDRRALRSCSHRCANEPMQAGVAIFNGGAMQSELSVKSYPTLRALAHHKSGLYISSCDIRVPLALTVRSNLNAVRNNRCKNRSSKVVQMSAFRMTKDIFSAIGGGVAEDIREHPLEPAKVLAITTYLVGMLFFDVNFWKALVVIALIAIAMMYNFGTRRIIQLSVIVMLFTVSVWIELIPYPNQWLSLAKSATVVLR